MTPLADCRTWAAIAGRGLAGRRVIATAPARAHSQAITRVRMPNQIWLRHVPQPTDSMPPPRCR